MTISQRGGWWSLIDIFDEASDLVLQGWEQERLVCPNDGEPLRSGPEGELYCPFDGYRPGVS